MGQIPGFHFQKSFCDSTGLDIPRLNSFQPKQLAVGTSNFKVTMTILAPALLKATLRRAPFCIFSKTAPLTLPVYNVDNDFVYYFFNDCMQDFSGMSPSFLTTTGDRNAKTDFPVDYETYFQDDAAVCQEYPHPKVKVITERWITPAMTTILETRKTAIQQDGKLFMLGCFAPHDDVELGITTFRASQLPPPTEDLAHVPLAWYNEAFRQLPLSTILTDGENVLARNDLATVNEMHVDSDSFAACLEQIKSVPDRDCYQFSDVKLSGNDHPASRVWMWRPDVDNRSVLAISARPKHGTIPVEVRSVLSL
jgi:hypothetical protein